MRALMLGIGLLATTVGCATSITENYYVGDGGVGGQDSSTIDSSEAIDTNEPSIDTGTSSKDSGTAADTYVADSGTTDTFVPDTYVPDTYVPDTYVPDTYVADTYVPDTYVPPTPVEVTFPATGDTKGISKDPYIWTSGDWIQGVRTTTLAKATSLTGTWQITNSLSSCGKVYADVSINGTKVGALTISSGTSNVPVSFTFAAITGPTYTLRYQLTSTVSSGCGAIQTTWDTSKLTLN